MKNKNIKAICFDMWGTLCESGGAKQWDELQNILQAESIDKKIFVRQGEKNLLLYPGLLSDGIKNLANKIQRKMNNATLEKAYRTWQGHVLRSKPYPETINVLDKLKKMQIRLFIISNTDSESFYFKIKQFKLKKYFEKFFLSSEIGTLKPHEKIFQTVQDYLRLQKKQIIMIDDSLYHGVLSARKFGWQALWLARGKKGQDIGRIEDLNGIFNFL